MHELSAHLVGIDDPFWSPRLAVNAGRAILHQWEQLERTRCIENFRITAGEMDGFREGWFFADSDAYKWLDAACRIQLTHPSPLLRERTETLIDLLARAQQPDGYLYTYNQIHFPGQRWVNLQIEHELYCLGHLIEACLSHEEMQSPPGEPGLALKIACRAADLLVREIMDAGPEYTDGHEEIEIALLKLHRTTGDLAYLELARRLILRRGRIPHFWRMISRQESSRRSRDRQVQARRAAYLAAHPERASFALPPGNVAGRVRLGRQRRLLSALSGRMFQQDHPLRDTRVPVGHAVRFAYLMAAAAMLARAGPDAGLRSALEATWRRMVERRMYVTGGLGSLPAIEGFGRDYELDPEASYSETCAALGSLFWNWEMLLLTCEARYADLFEWQLYNAASVGIGWDGTTYLYNNPLTCRGGVERRSWYAVPCCPSNLSRTWASLARYLVSTDGDAIWVHQYTGCRAAVPLEPATGGQVEIALRIESHLPWNGRVRIEVGLGSRTDFTMHARIPSWTRGFRVLVNGRLHEPLPLPPDRQTPVSTACGYAPHGAFFVPIRRTWAPGDAVELELPMPIVARRPSPRVRGSRGTAAVSRGPIVYCIESVDHPGVAPDEVRVDLTSLRAEPDPALLPAPGGEDPLWVLRGQSSRGEPLTLIPYFAWGNRGASRMSVMVRV